jgi:hypothetical protein
VKIATTVRAVLGAVLILSSLSGQAAQCVSLEKLVSQRGTFPNHASAAIAWSGTTLGVAKNDHEPIFDRNEIWFALYSGDLTQLSTDVRIADASRRGVMHLIWTGREFGLFYQRTDLQLMLARIGANGAPLSAPTPVATQHSNYGGDEYDIIWEPTRNAYAVIRTISQGTERGLWAIFIEENGAFRQEQMLDFFIASPTVPRVAVTTTGTIGVSFVHSATKAIYVTRIEPNGRSFGNRVLSSGAAPRIASDGEGFVVVAARPSADLATSEIWWVRLDGNARVVVPEEFFFAGRGVDVLPVNIIWNDDRDEYALGFLDSRLGFTRFPGEYRLYRFEGNGDLISQTLFSPELLRNTYTTDYPFVWTGEAYITTTERFIARAEGSDSYLIRHCPLTANIVVPSEVTILTTTTLTADVSGGSGPFTYQWTFGDNTRPSTTAVTQHRYEKLGTFTVTLVVTDAAGARSVTTKTVRVVEPAPPPPPVIPRRRAVR